MAYERGMAAIRLESPDEIPHTQYISHPHLATALTGLAPFLPHVALCGKKKLLNVYKQSKRC